VTTPQIPVPQPVPPHPQPVVGQPTSPVDFFRRMPGGGTVYVKPSTPTDSDPLLCLRARTDGYQPTCGENDHCPSCQLCADVHADTCPYHQSRRPLPEPNACAACEASKDDHPQRWSHDLGWHGWIAPRNEVRFARMLARRHARTQETIS
jgi:hypothetical protein